MARPNIKPKLTPPTQTEPAALQHQELDRRVEPLDGPMQQDVLTTLLHDDTGALVIRQRVPAHLFSTRAYRDIAVRAFAFIDAHGTAPKGHADSIVADLLTAKDDAYVALIKAALQGANELSETFNPSFVLDSVDRFVFEQTMKIAWVDGHQLMLRGDYEGAVALVEKAKAAAATTAHSIDEGEVVLQQGSSIGPESVTWLWPQWLARRKLELVAGPPEAGKTTAAEALIAILSSGRHWPDGAKSKAGNVLVWSGEDDIADTLVPRLVAMNADMSRVFFVAGVKRQGKTITFDPSKHLDALEAQARKIEGGVDLILIDPVVSVVTGDSHKTAEVRRGMQPLCDMAIALNCCVVGITHVVKGSRGAAPLERLVGSGAFGALPRIVIMVVAVKDDPEGRRLFVPIKSNIGARAPGLYFTIGEATLKPPFDGVQASRVKWLKDQVDGSAYDLLRDAEGTDADDQAACTTSAKEDAKAFLSAILKGGQVDSKLVKAKAREADVSESALRKAREAMAIVVDRVGAGQAHVSYWSLPASEQ